MQFKNIEIEYLYRKEIYEFLFEYQRYYERNVGYDFWVTKKSILEVEFESIAK